MQSAPSSAPRHSSSAAGRHSPRTARARRSATRCSPRSQRSAACRPSSCRRTSRARIVARIEAAEKAGRISPERAACSQANASRRATSAAPGRCASTGRAHGMIGAAAAFLELDRERASGRSSRAIRSRASPRSRARASTLWWPPWSPPRRSGSRRPSPTRRSPRQRADAALDKLEALAGKLAQKVFPAKG